MKCFIFTCMNHLQYVTCHFFMEREGIREYIKIATNVNCMTTMASMGMAVCY